MAAEIGKQIYDFVDEVPAAVVRWACVPYETARTSRRRVSNAATDFCKINCNTGAEWWQPEGEE